MELIQGSNPVVVKARSTIAELEENANAWAKLAQNSLPEDVGFIMLLTIKGAEPGTANYMVANLPNRVIKAEMKAVSKEMHEKRVLRIGGRDE